MKFQRRNYQMFRSRASSGSQRHRSTRNIWAISTRNRQSMTLKSSRSLNERISRRSSSRGLQCRHLKIFITPNHREKNLNEKIEYCFSTQNLRSCCQNKKRLSNYNCWFSSLSWNDMYLVSFPSFYVIFEWWLFSWRRRCMRFLNWKSEY